MNINFLQALTDLKTRLDLDYRFQSSLQDVNFEYGMKPEVLKSFIDFWRNKYNWREREAKLNKMPQYVTQVSGLAIHFVHAKPNNVPKGMKVIFVFFNLFLIQK
jgi:Epoxide hydrolase N terminus